MVLFKDGLKFRGIYVHNLDNDQVGFYCYCRLLLLPYTSESKDAPKEAVDKRDIPLGISTLVAPPPGGTLPIVRYTGRLRQKRAPF